jgi:hypothetical protein
MSNSNPALDVYEAAARTRDVARAKAQLESIDSHNARVKWEREIRASDEAASRPAATERLLSIASPAKMSVAQARATLRGIRPEGAVVEGLDIPSAPDVEADYRTRRAAEIKASGIAIRAARGDTAARRELAAGAVFEDGDRPTPPAAPGAVAPPREARAEELRQSALHYRASKGDAAAKAELKRLQAA